MNGIYYTESYSQFKSGEKSAYTYLCLQINFAKFEAFQIVSCADLSNSLYLYHARMNIVLGNDILFLPITIQVADRDKICVQLNIHT